MHENDLFIDANVDVAKLEDGFGFVKLVGNGNEDDVVLGGFLGHEVFESQTGVGGEAGVDTLARQDVEFGGIQIARAPLVRSQIGDVLAGSRRQLMRLRTGNGAIHNFQRLIQFVLDDRMGKRGFRNDTLPTEIPLAKGQDDSILTDLLSDMLRAINNNGVFKRPLLTIL